MALYLGNTKIAGSGAAADIPDTYKTYAETSAQLSNDGYATQGWVREQDFGGGISLSDVQATIFDFGNGDLSAFGWTGELSQQDLVDAGIKDSSGAVVKHPAAVRIGNGVTSVGDSAFEGCSGLSSVTIGNGVTSIGNRAFFGCSGLSSMTIGDGEPHIGVYALSGCTNLSEIRVEGKTQAEAEALLANARVPDGCQIKTWSFVPPIYNFTKKTSVAYQPKQASTEYIPCQYETPVDGWYYFRTDINPDATSITNTMMISYVTVNGKTLYYNSAGSSWATTCYIKAGCVLKLCAYTSSSTDNNASGARHIYLLT